MKKEVTIVENCPRVTVRNKPTLMDFLNYYIIISFCGRFCFQISFFFFNEIEWGALRRTNNIFQIHCNGLYARTIWPILCWFPSHCSNIMRESLGLIFKSNYQTKPCNLIFYKNCTSEIAFLTANFFFWLVRVSND